MYRVRDVQFYGVFNVLIALGVLDIFSLFPSLTLEEYLHIF